MSYIQIATKFPKEKSLFESKEKEKRRGDFTKKAFCVIICIAIFSRRIYYEVKLSLYHFGLL